MGNDTITVTGKTGPASQMTAKVFNYVTRLDLQISRDVLLIEHEKGLSEVELSTITTITATVTAGVIAVTIS